MVLSKIQGVSGDSVKQKLGQSWASQVALVVKNLPASAGDLGCQRRGFVAWVGKIPWRGHGNPLQYSCWRILWIEESGGLQSMGHKESGRTEGLSLSIFTR